MTTAERHVELLGQALGRILVAAGVVEDVPMTGPQLLLAANGYAEYLEARLTAAVVVLEAEGD